MATVRCYVPLTPQQVEDLRTRRQLDGPLPAYAVTPRLRADLPSGDLEEWEYAALQEAAASQAAASAPVIVAAADLDERDVRLVDRPDGGGDQSSARVPGLELPRVAALHLGDDVVSGTAVAVAGDGHLELSWYDTTEIGHVAELARAVATG